jgi:hypothetical protein
MGKIRDAWRSLKGNRCECCELEEQHGEYYAFYGWGFCSPIDFLEPVSCGYSWGFGTGVLSTSK